MYKNQKVSVILPVYNERENIRQAIEGFFSHPAVDEVIVVDNNSNDGSAEEINKTRAKYIFEGVQGYGSALRRGLESSSGDLMVTVEPDGTFRVADIDKLLIYSADFEVVFGTRTSRSLVWSGANMDFSLRLGNWAVAKFLEYLFNGPSLTDVGCTYKLIHRCAYEQIKNKLKVKGSHFSPEFMIRVLQGKLKAAEIPVHYQARIGTSKITGKKTKAIKLGLRMIFLILNERIKSIFKNG